ncbi:MAG TPA: transglutaminase domain-containing protein [Nanoarchaeota archaeon]|nr:transglutaminase domain-containing protein [Nanoarchaeota archaeon]
MEKPSEKDYKNYAKYIQKYFLISVAIVIVLVLFVLWATGVFKVCGDFYCTAKECISGCKDCDADSCLDRICQPQSLENCDNSGDCTCDINQVCGPYRPGSDEKGCYAMRCGDNFCDAKGESKEKCCLDCGCNPGYECNKEKNECQFLTPGLDINVNSVITGVSASTIYSNRGLIDDEGKKRPLVSMNITNNAPNIAKKVAVSLKIGNYTAEQSEGLGDMGPGESKGYDWYPTPTENILTIKDNINALIVVVASFEDEHGKRYTSTKSIPLEIAGRSNWADYSSVSQFVTPLESVVRQTVSAAGSFSTRDDEGIDQAARQIWDMLGGLGIEYISDPTLEYRQYPADVLKTKKGDCDDLSTLYAALLESVGIKTALITHPGHMYAAYYDSEHINPVETTMIGSSFKDARDEGNKEYGEHKNDKYITVIEDEWKAKDIKTPGDVGISTSEVSISLIEVRHVYNAEWVCDTGTPDNCQHYALNVYCDLTFINSGTGEGQKCVDVSTFVDDRDVHDEVVCKTVEGGSSETARVTYTNPSQPNAPFQYRCQIK